MYVIDPNKKGSKRYYENILNHYVEMGIEYFKLDNIHREMPKFEKELMLISDCLKNCGIEIFFSNSQGYIFHEFSQVCKETENM